MSDSSVHTIKLQGPWTVLRCPGDCGQAPQTVRLPTGWRAIFDDAPGTAVFERRFHRPTGLSDRHEVRLVFTRITGLSGVTLNGVELEIVQIGPDIQTVDITTRMLTHNRLAVAVRFDPAQDADDPGGLWQPVVLQIEEHQERQA